MWGSTKNNVKVLKGSTKALLWSGFLECYNCCLNWSGKKLGNHYYHGLTHAMKGGQGGSDWYIPEMTVAGIKMEKIK